MGRYTAEARGSVQVRNLMPSRSARRPRRLVGPRTATIAWMPGRGRGWRPTTCLKRLGRLYLTLLVAPGRLFVLSRHREKPGADPQADVMPQRGEGGRRWQAPQDAAHRASKRPSRSGPRETPAQPERAFVVCGVRRYAGTGRRRARAEWRCPAPCAHGGAPARRRAAGPQQVARLERVGCGRSARGRNDAAGRRIRPGAQPDDSQQRPSAAAPR